MAANEFSGSARSRRDARTATAPMCAGLLHGWGAALAMALAGRLGRAFALALVVTLAAAAGYEGFYGKWRLRDGEAAMSWPAMLDGTAYRPYVYRRLVPDAATAAERALPTPVRTRLTQTLGANGPRLGVDGADAYRPGYTLRYFLAYFGGFAALLAALAVLFGLSRRWFGVPASLAAVTAMALLFPVLQSVGGFVYDFTELLFLATGVWLAARGGRTAWLLPPLAAVATLNKESFVFFLPALLPLLWAAAGPRKALLMLAAAGSASVAVYAAVRERFAANPGGTVEPHLRENLAFYADPTSLLRLEGSYGLPLFAGYSLVTLAFVLVVGAAGWPSLTKPLRRHIQLAALINIPLVLLFCAPGETRNLSLLFPGLVLLMAAAVQRWLASAPVALEPSR